MELQTKTLKLRIKPRHNAVLEAMAFDVNQVWNYLNDLSHRAIRERKLFLSGFDLQKYTAGYSKCEGVNIGSSTIQQTCEEYATRRKQFKKSRLNWRVSNRKSPKYSLGWVPFKKGAVRYQGGQIIFAGKRMGLWDSYGLSKFDLRAGSFSQDARGRWYVNLCVQFKAEKTDKSDAVGIDFGWKEAAVCSNGLRIEGRWYRGEEQALADAQRKRKKKRVQAIHAKIKNRRKDALHKLSTNLVSNFGAIAYGDVSATKMSKINGKSTLDSGWGMLSAMLEYKGQWAGVAVQKVNERFSTQSCSCCGVISDNSPRGRAGLNIRTWQCSECGSTHDRDENAAKNILMAAGFCRSDVRIPALRRGE